MPSTEAKFAFQKGNIFPTNSQVLETQTCVDFNYQNSAILSLVSINFNPTHKENIILDLKYIAV